MGRRRPLSHRDSFLPIQGKSHLQVDDFLSVCQGFAFDSSLQAEPYFLGDFGILIPFQELEIEHSWPSMYHGSSNLTDSAGWILSKNQKPRTIRRRQPG